MTTIQGSLERVLCVSPHTDDWEIGAGGFVMFLRDQGACIRILACSAAEESVPSKMPRDINRLDATRAAAVAGISGDDVEVLGLPVRRFDEHRQDLLEHLIQVRKSFKPTLVIGPSSTDRHQDHAVVFAEVRRAFGAQTVLGYEIPWNCPNFSADVHVDLEETHLTRKIEAVGCYRSQAGRPYVNSDFLRSWAVFRGIQGKLQLAEAFELIHWRIQNSHQPR